MPNPPTRAPKFPHKDKGLYGERDFNIGDEVWVAYRGHVMAFNANDSCMQVQSATALMHYVFDADPSVIILPQAATWPPKRDDVWLIGGKVWHTADSGVLYRSATNSSRNGGLSIARTAESVLHSVDTPPELLFRFHV